MLEVIGLATQQNPDLLVIDELTQPRLFNAALYAALGSSYVFGGLRFATLASGLAFVLEAAENRTVLCSALRGVANHAVLPRLCTSCRTKEDRGPRAARLLGLPLEAALPDSLRRPAGCEKCGGTGYRGTFVLLEVLNLTDDLVALLKSGEPAAKLVPQLLTRVEPSLVSQARELAFQGEIAADDVASLMGNGNRGAN
jgi:type IV pilus assembly protein PilB